MIRIRIEGFLDGARVQKELSEPSRWEIQEAERVRIDIGDAPSSSSSASAPSTSSSSSSSSSFLSIDLVQLPRCLSSSKVGVGAVLWDGGIVLTALLASLPPSALLGEVIVELGAGVGAPSLAAAKRGARVISTDKEAAVRGVLQQNVERSGMLSPSCRLPPEPGKIALRALEFGTEEGDAAAAALADAVGGGGVGGGGGGRPEPVPSSAAAALSSSASASVAVERGIDLVLAADCVYSDGDGESPDPEALCRAAARLLMRRSSSGGGGGGGSRDASSPPPAAAAPSSSRVWLASEERDAETHALFERAAARHFASVRRLQLPAEVFGGTSASGKKKKKKKSEGGGSAGESPWGHVRVFELAGAGAGTESGLSLSAAEMRALKKPRKRGWP